MWQVRLRIRVARPRARGRQRLSVVPSSAKQADDEQLLRVEPVVVEGVGGCRVQQLADHVRHLAVAVLEDLRRPLVRPCPG